MTRLRAQEGSAICRAEKAEAAIARVESAVHVAVAHRFDFDSTSIVGPGGKVGGPDSFYNGANYVTSRVCAALDALLWEKGRQ